MPLEATPLKSSSQKNRIATTITATVRRTVAGTIHGLPAQTTLVLPIGLLLEVN
jgi:hypothetical protein